MEYLDRYGHRYIDRENLSPKVKQYMFIIQALIGRVKKIHNLKTHAEVAKLIGVSERHFSRIANCRLSPLIYIPVLCFYADVRFSDIIGEFVERDLDEYIDELGNMIINGIKIQTRGEYDDFNNTW